MGVLALQPMEQYKGVTGEEQRRTKECVLSKQVWVGRRTKVDEVGEQREESEAREELLMADWRSEM